jgi:hypothetical protein
MYWMEVVWPGGQVVSNVKEKESSGVGKKTSRG